MRMQQIFDHGDGWWVDEGHRLQTTKTSALSKQPRMIVLHWTAAPCRSTTDNLARIQRWAADAGDKSSTHFVILRTGEVWQMAPTTRATWHAGNSAWTCQDGTKSTKSVNLFSLGIDFDNVGPVTQGKDGMLYDCYGGRFEGVAQDIKGKLYEAPSDNQLWACRVLLDALRTRFGIAQRDIVGHLDVSPGRKIDPGPLVTRHTLGME